MNEIWRTGKFPEDWHKAVIIPIPKPGKDKTEATNYRPIALTSCICKTMERMMNDRLVWFLESNNLISGIQAGFRKNYCTNAHLVRLDSFIRDAFIKKEHCVAIFFDLEKAYETATGFILQHRFFANFTCLSSLLRYFKPLENINIGRRH